MKTNNVLSFVHMVHEDITNNVLSFVHMIHEDITNNDVTESLVLPDVL